MNCLMFEKKIHLELASGTSSRVIRSDEVLSLTRILVPSILRSVAARVKSKSNNRRNRTNPRWQKLPVSTTAESA